MPAGQTVIQPVYHHWKKMENDELIKVLSDFFLWCEKGKIVIDKNGHAVPLKLNEAQKAVARLIIPKILAKVPEPVTLVIHKSRQMGISTVLAAIEQYVASRKRSVNIVHIMPSEELAKSFGEEKWIPLLEATHPQLLPDCSAAITPTPRIRIRTYGGKNMNSNVRIVGSESRAASRGTTNQVVILDEYAFYTKVNNLERGVLATIPKTGLALTVYVSTANGTNSFYDLVQQSKKSGNNIEHLFLPWHMIEEYEVEPSKNSRYYDLDNWEPSEYDMKLMDIFEQAGYPQESWIRKMAFYEKVLEDDAKGDQDYMFQEYPSTQEESFLATGRPVLPPKVIEHYLKNPVPTFYLDQFLDEKRNKVYLAESERSNIICYKKPVAGHRYMIGVDPSEGYSADLSAGVVVDMNTMEEVCWFNDFVDQTELAELCANIGYFYNTAIIVPERNMGQTLIEFLKQIGYPRVYIDIAQTTNKTIKYGVRTTIPSKNEMKNRLRFLLINGLYKPHDPVFLEQAQHFNYVFLPKLNTYRMEATGTDDDGHPWHDDAVMARMILMMAIDMGKFRGYMEKNKLNNGKIKA